MIALINARTDEIKKRILNDGSLTESGDDILGERKYPLCIMPEKLKGTKPTSVIFDGETVKVNTWKKVYGEVLKRCDADENNHKRLLRLRYQIMGRKRTILAGNTNGMSAPIKLSEELYAEAFFDTPGLIYILTKRILDAVPYDYSRIYVTVRAGRGRRYP